MYPNEMVNLINTRIIDIAPRVKPPVQRLPVSNAYLYRIQRLIVPLSPSGSPLLPPLQEFAEQSFAIGFILRHIASNAIHERLEIATHIVLG